MITIPMIGWSPKLGAGRSILYSYSVTKYGPQTSTDPYLPNAGNGISITNNTPITWNNPNDANFPTNTAFQQGYVQHLIRQLGVVHQWRRGLLHHGQRAQHLVLDASGHPSGGADHAGNLDRNARPTPAW